MRFILMLAAGAAALAIGTVAQARPGGGGGGNGAGASGALSYGPAHHSGRGGALGYGPGSIRGGRHHGPRHGRFGRGGFDAYGGIGIGIAGSPVEADRHGNGFFAGGGGRIRLRGGQPVFDYNRSYPYEWASAGLRGEAPERAEEAQAAPPGPRCTFENGVRVCRGW